MIRKLDRSGFLSIFSSASRIRDSITGTTTMAVTLCFSMSSSTSGGLNLPAQHQRRAQEHPKVACR